MAGWGGLGGPLWYAAHTVVTMDGGSQGSNYRRGMEWAEMEPEVITFNVCS